MILSFIYKEIVPIDVEASYTIKKVPVLSFELGSGSKEMEEEIPKFLKNNKIVVIKGHGAIGLGETLEEALFYNSVLENSCKIIMGIHSLGKNPEEFTPKEINRGW